ncbi:MAG: hydrogenase-4 component G [Desulfobulbaceae bacterium]|uniref:Hydrogenase-4 component G n=1 Tax=Candidatus Desulfobia pelagia TaxID=2841692 RepID=A0A8J6TBJ8_9BACT|nr:hydrogenase-4 component G [Candidatus Desulfobia pelagia]
MQEKYTKELSPEEKRGQSSKKAVGENVKLSMKAKLVEFLLVVKNETTENFEKQSVLEQQTTGDGLDLVNLQYNGKPLSDLSPDEAQILIAEDGYFGVTKTAERIADFVLSGAGDNLERLQAGRKGVQKGFQDAEEAWGGKLPEISYQTYEKALEMIDARIKELGGALVDVVA